MTKLAGGALFALLLAPAPAPADSLVIRHENGAEILRTRVADGAGWCILWRHSVQGFEVKDCYLNMAGAMVLDRSHLPDFAAGLDHIPGRGVQLSDGHGGYWIEDLNEPVPDNAYVLRPGSMKVDHRVAVNGLTVSLSAVAEHERVRIGLEPDRE